MDSDQDYCNSDDDSPDPSANFSYFTESSSIKKISQVPQSESVTPQSSSPYQIKKQKKKGKNTKKQTKKKPKAKPSLKKLKEKAQITKPKQDDLNSLKNKHNDSEEKNEGQKIFGNSNRFALSSKEATYLTRSQFPKKYSLRDANRSQEFSFEKADKKNSKTIYSEGYHFIESFINQMLQNDQVPQFFKYDIYEVTKLEAAKKYYQEYTNVIRNPLSLSRLLWMAKNGVIKNYLQFNRKFDELILNSRFFHTLKGNLHMINCGEFLKRKLYEKFCRDIHPEGNLYELDLIKTISQKKLKTEEENHTRFMELTDQHNKYRFSVMNKFLKIVCFKTPQKVDMFLGTFENIISRYPSSKVQIIKHQQIIENSQKDKKIPKQFNPNSKICSQAELNSPITTNSRALSDSEAIYLEIVPKKIQVDLFQQIKTLIRREVQEKKSSTIFGQEMRDETDKIMYPREDSDEFEIDDESDDF